MNERNPYNLFEVRLTDEKEKCSRIMVKREIQ